MQGSAVVLGAGIAGLATARGLLRAGWTVHVLERSPGLPDTGTALGMWPEAMHALDRLGVGEGVRSSSVEQRGGRLLRPDGTEIARLDLGRPVRLVPRPVLLTALAAMIPPGVIAWNTPVTDHGELPAADIVVAAEGIHSPTRAALFGTAPRALGTVAFRGTVPGPADGVTETWGPGRLFGITPHDAGNTNWFASIRADLLPPETSPRSAAQLLRKLYGDWHREVRRVLDALGDTPIDRRTLLDVAPPPSYVSGRTAILGDAAHGMAPNLGRGACEALLDATVLVEALTAAPDVAGALRRYDDVRRRPATRTVRLARLANTVSTVQHLLPVRNTIMAAASHLSRLG
ncbi:FAD-dependent oxidoreductase [Kocuria oceani]|uniref:FAD-dependent oxidoreductase n=1 Tax=Kocuria oceani TaxID=988827 RepID=A0ABV9TLB6_9MICC|nr:FAD-dependent oxidoreductase [Kocuria oceani]